MIRKMLIGSLLLLASCQEAPNAEAEAEVAKMPDGAVSLGKLYDTDIAKFCDNGRAVYVGVAYGRAATAITVVDDAKECSTGNK